MYKEIKLKKKKILKRKLRINASKNKYIKKCNHDKTNILKMS